MSQTLGTLESKVKQAVEELQNLRKDNARLKSECEMLKSQLALTGGENKKAQRVLAEYEHMKRTQEQATVRVERALERLSAMRLN